MAGHPPPIDELRDILVGGERRRLEEIEQRLADAPKIEDALQAAVRRNPRSLADAIFPIMGPAIRKAIATTLAELVQSLNQALEHSLTIRGLSWRLEALRTGKPFAEVVLRHTLLYRVEQLFLIHRETGLLLQHVMAPAIASQSPDMVSGMLTAIQDFVRDSFGGGKESLESLQVGDMTVWVEQGSDAVLAAVIRGTPPSGFRSHLGDTMALVQAQMGADLAAFAGDAEPFEAVRPDLEELLLEQAASHARPGRSRAALIAAAVLGLVIVVLAILAWRSSSRWHRYVNALHAEPGIVVAQADQAFFGRDRLTGLRDELSADPVALALAAGVDTADVRMEWKGYLSTDAALLRRHAARSADSLVARIESVTVPFETGSSVLPGGHEKEFARLRRDLDALALWTRAAGEQAELVVRGHTDPTGTDDANAILSVARARTVAADLVKDGAGIGTLPIRAEGDSSTARDRLASLHVTRRAMERPPQ